MLYSCDTCHRPLEFDEGFFRSINLRTVAWCRDCWVARHADLGIPAQRQAPEEDRAEERAKRRWSARG
jgi:hypothetical protein